MKSKQEQCFKYCSRCKVNKPKIEFNKRKASKDGLAYWCSTCIKEYLKFHPVDRVKAREAERRYEDRNHEKIKQRKREEKRIRRADAGKSFEKKPLTVAMGSGRRVTAKPLQDVLTAYKLSTGLDNREIALQCGVDNSYVSKLILGQYTVVTEQIAEKILFGINREHLWNDLYPTEGK